MSLILINFISTESPPSMFSLHHKASTSKASETVMTSWCLAIIRKRSKKWAGTPGCSKHETFSCSQQGRLTYIITPSTRQETSKVANKCAKSPFQYLLQFQVHFFHVGCLPHPFRKFKAHGFRNSGSFVRVFQDDIPASHSRSSSSSL